MAIPYRHKRSTAAGVEPTTLQDGEIAINTAAADPKLFYKDSASTIRAFSLASYASSTHTHVASSITNLTSVANVVSVNGQTGVVVLTNSSVSAASATHTHVAADITNLTSVANVVSVNAKTGVVTISHTDVTAASSTHTHAASDVTSGTFDAARLPDVIDCGELTAAPGSPTSLAGSAGNASVALTWSAPAYEGTSAITGYRVEYTPSGGSASTVDTASTSTSYTLTGLTNDTAYGIRVAAINDVGASGYTDSISRTPTASTPLALDDWYQVSWPAVAVSFTGTGSSGSPAVAVIGATGSGNRPSGQFNGDVRMWLLIGSSGTLSYSLVFTKPDGNYWGEAVLYKTSLTPSQHSQSFATSLNNYTTVHATDGSVTGTTSVTAGDYLVLRWFIDDGSAGSAPQATATLSIS
jgi:hypothetical protein